VLLLLSSLSSSSSSSCGRKTEGKRTFGRPGRRWEDMQGKMDLK
jgi:hypothetical protein